MLLPALYMSVGGRRVGGCCEERELGECECAKMVAFLNQSYASDGGNCALTKARVSPAF